MLEPNALAAINVVYPLVNILYGIALAFATGGSALAALHIGGKKNDEASRTFSVSMAAAIVIGALVSALILFRLPAHPADAWCNLTVDGRL